MNLWAGRFRGTRGGAEDARGEEIVIARWPICLDTAPKKKASSFVSPYTVEGVMSSKHKNLWAGLFRGTRGGAEDARGEEVLLPRHRSCLIAHTILFTSKTLELFKTGFRLWNRIFGGALSAFF